MDDISATLFGEEEKTEQEEVSKAEQRIEFLLKQGFTKENIEMKTDLSKSAIRAIAKAKMHATLFGDQTVDLLCDLVMTLNISKDRKGRGELTELTRMVSVENETGGNSGMLSRLLGG